MEERPDLPLQCHEHRLSEPTTVSMMKTFGVRSVPTLLIDGRILYESVVPTRSELLHIIDRMVREKKLV
jgi:predicted DsbA family dithiol-disulfide isomerase